MAELIKRTKINEIQVGFFHWHHMDWYMDLLSEGVGFFFQAAVTFKKKHYCEYRTHDVKTNNELRF